MRLSRLSTLSLPALAVGAAIALAACASSTSPGWTYEPPPPATPTPAPTTAPSGEPSTAPSGEPSTAPSGEPSTAPSDAPGGQVIKLVAQNIAYDLNAIEVTSGQPFTIEFANQDAGVPHNVAIKDAMGMEVFKGEIFNGAETRTYQVPALPKGDYTFYCSVHSNMTGTLSSL
jgi:plastocyanin